MKKSYDTILRLGIGLAFVALILAWLTARGWGVGVWDLINTEYITMFGWMFALGLAFTYFLQDGLDTLRCVAYGGMIGISFSVLVGYMYNNNIWFDTVIIGTNLLWEVQLIITMIWVIVGIIKGVSSNG